MVALKGEEPHTGGGSESKMREMKVKDGGMRGLVHYFRLYSWIMSTGTTS